jgi:hypothetical protein
MLLAACAAGRKAALAPDGFNARSCGAFCLGEEIVAEEKPDIGKLVDEAAKAIGLAVAPEYGDDVILNYKRSLAIAAPLLAMQLDDDLTPAPVFRP